MKQLEDLLLPPDLRLLFVDETAVHAVEESLRYLQSNTRSELGLLSSKRSFLNRSLGRFWRSEEPTKLDQDAEKIDRALSICYLIRQKLKAELEKEVEWFLRENCEPYKRGLAAGLLNEDWHRAILSFQASLRAYILELGQSRNMVVSNYNRATGQISESARVAVDKAISIARDLVKHTDFVNQVVDQQHELVKDSPVADNFLPRLPLADYVGWTEALLTKELGPMQAHYDHILSLCETLVGPGILELEQALRALDGLNAKANESFVLAFIELNHVQAREKWFNPSSIKDILARLETKYETPPLPYTFELSAAATA